MVIMIYVLFCVNNGGCMLCVLSQSIREMVIHSAMDHTGRWQESDAIGKNNSEYAELLGMCANKHAFGVYVIF